MRDVVTKVLKGMMGVITGLALLLACNSVLVYADEPLPAKLTVKVKDVVVDETKVVNVTPGDSYEIKVVNAEGKQVDVESALYLDDVEYTGKSTISTELVFCPSIEDVGKTISAVFINREDDTSKTTVKFYVDYIAEKITLDKTTDTMTMQDKHQLVATVTPAAAINKEVEWTSDDTAIATVSATGEVTAVAPGTCSIKATVKGTAITAVCVVTVKAPSLNTTTKSIAVKKSFTLKVRNLPGTITWKSSDTKIAKVKNGVVTGVKAGTVTISATSGTNKVSCKVKVTNPAIVNSNNDAVEGIYVTVGYKRVLKIKGSSSKVVWSSSNDKIATINKGEVTGKKTGYCYVYAKIDGTTIKCKVTVKANKFSVTPVRSGRRMPRGKVNLSNASIYYSGGKLIYQCNAVNSTNYKKIQKYNKITIAIYSNNKLVARQTYRNVKLNLRKNGYKSLTFTFAKQNVKRVVDLRTSNMRVQYSYSYKYIN